MEPVIYKREALFELVWKIPATKLAEQYNLPYSEFKKICEEYAIPLPGSGYWSKLRAGKIVHKPVLPTEYTGPEEVTIEAQTKSQIRAVRQSCKSNTPEQGSKFRVPAKLTNADPLIVAVKYRFDKERYLHDGLALSGAGNISIAVAPKNVPRALRFMDAFIKLLKKRGYSLRVERHSTYAIIEEEEFEIRLREKTNRSVVKDGSWDRSVFTPSGTLIFKLDTYPRREWKDGTLLLEDRIVDIIEYLEQRSIEKKEWRIKREKEEAEHMERLQIQRELEARQEKELARFKRLLHDAKRWKEVKILREYIADMGSESSRKHLNPEAHEAWLKWAEQKADWYDPQINAIDELLNAVDKETLTLPKKTGYYGW